MKLKIRKKDRVMVISGRDKGKISDVIKVIPDAEGGPRLLLSKVNVVAKHRKARQNEPGGIQRVEAPIHYSNVMLVCPKCDKAVRPKGDRLSTGEVVRVCRKCGETIL